MAEQGNGEHHDTIDALSAENRTFPPSEEFKANSLVTGTFLYDQAAEDDEAFWARQASGLVDWVTPWDTILEWDLPDAKWFVGGQLNVAYNCLDRHVLGGKGDKVAILWEGEPGDTRTITYRQLLDEVSQFANVLKGLGVKRGDRVNIYLPMIPEAAVAMLACARIGAVHSVVFGGFSSQSLADRINDAEAKVLITADGGYRRGEVFPLKPAADEACVDCSDDRTRRGRQAWRQRRRHERRPRPLVPRADGGRLDRLPRRADGLRAAAVPALHLGYHRQAEGHPAHLRRLPDARAPTPTSTSSTSTDTDVFWCTADVGWITGHSYIVYGPLANGATQVMYEGAPNHPGNDRFWEIVEKYGVTIFYTAPTAIRAFIKWGAGEPAKHDLSSLRLLGIGRRADQPGGLDVVPASTSAADGARSSTPGGRPRPAAS